MNSIDKLVPLGLLKRPHGLKGELGINFFNKDCRLLKKNQIVCLIYKQNSIVDSRIERMIYSANNNLIKFFEIDTREDASKLTGYTLSVKRSQLPDLEKGEFYLFDLIDYVLLDENRNKYGIVTDVLEFPANDVLEVSDEENEYLIPVINDVIITMNHDNKEIIINPIKGLFD